MVEKELIKVAMLGPEGSYSYEAAKKAFPKTNYLLESSIKSVFEKVENKKAEFGVVPIENSTDGSISATLDLLAEKNLTIAAELFLDIKHCFLSNEKNKSEIKRIFSHPQGFAQCRTWIEKNFPSAELVECQSTALAAKRASIEKFSAAIASESSAKSYSLKIIQKDIHDLKGNKTRFAVVSIPEKISPFSNNEKRVKMKTSLLFAVKNKPGSLFDAIKSFKEFNINMTKIESRPSKKNAWEYVFFVDVEGSITQHNILQALDELNNHCAFVKVFGSYGEIK
ncbi:MAG: prephenate dehydratase [archaeon]|jgi:chorismate mutase/prephenate dehydratase